MSTKSKWKPKAAAASIASYGRSIDAGVSAYLAALQILKVSLKQPSKIKKKS